MANISLHGEDILIDAGKPYYVIDALYLEKVKEELSSLATDNIEEEIKSKVLPYTEAPFAVISSNVPSIKVSQIEKGDDENIGNTNFSTDTGLILFIEKSIFLDFLKLFDYDKLIEGNIEILNKSYWEELQKQFGERQCAAILAPGIKGGLDFDGSGLYEIQL